MVVVEHVLGSLIEASTLSQEQAWKDQRVASIGSDAFDLRSDVAQVGIVALSLVLGRALRDDEYPGRLSQLVESAMVTSVTGGREPMVGGLRSWLDRALQFDERRSFASAIEASADLHRLLEETDSVVVPLALEAFLSRLQTAIERDRQAPAVAPVVAVASEDAPTTLGETPVPVPDPVEPESTQAAEEMTTPASVYTATEVTMAPLAVASSPVRSIANPALLSFAVTESSRASLSSEPFSMHTQAQSSGAGSFWKEHPWSRQAAAAAVLTVLVGLGWAASRGAGEVRAEPSQPVTAATEPAKAPEFEPAVEPPPPPVPALPEVDQEDVGDHDANNGGTRGRCHCHACCRTGAGRVGMGHGQRTQRAQRVRKRRAPRHDPRRTYQAGCRPASARAGRRVDRLSRDAERQCEE